MAFAGTASEARQGLRHGGGEALERRGLVLQSGGGHPLRSRFGGVLAPIFWLFAAVAPAAAQGISPQASYADPSFQTVLNNPANLAHEVKYASQAKDDSDLENAIGAYDRLLFYNPALSRVRFELGVL
jgi:hypothetical protein